MAKGTEKARGMPGAAEGRDPGVLVRRAGLLVFAPALAVRLLYLFESSDAPTFNLPVVDAMVYHQAAERLAGGGGFSESFFFQPFLYPFVLAGVYRAFGVSILAAKLLQALLGSLTCLMAYHVGRKVLGPGAGIAAGLITAFYAPLIFFETELLATGTAAFFAAALVLLFLNAAEKSCPFLYMMLGLCGAAAVLTRPTFLPLFVACCIWLAVKLRHPPERRGFLLPGALLVLLGFALPAVPVAFANRHVTGRFGILPASGGLNLYVGNNPRYEETVNARLGSQWSDVIDLPKKHGVRGDLWEVQRFYYGKVREYALAEPLSFARGLLVKDLQFLSGRETPRNVDIYLFRRWSAVLSILLWKAGPFGFPFALLLPLALLGVFFHRRMPFVLPLSVLVYALSIVLVFVTARYRVPVTPLLAVLAGGGIAGLVRAFRKGQGRKLAAAGGLFAAALLLGTLPGPFTAEGMDYEAELHCCLAEVLQRSGRIDEAVTEFRKAIALDEDYADAHANIATLHLLEGRRDEAVQAYLRALEIEPDLAQALCNLAAVRTDEGKYAEAEALCERGLKVRPHEEAFHFNLARIHAEQGNAGETIRHLEAAIALNPRHVQSHFELARLLERLGRTDRAIAHLREAAGIDTDSFTVHYELGGLLLRTGRSADAVKPLVAAVGLAPDNLDARHTLAVALAQSGRSVEAVAEYRAVLTRGPDYVPSLAGLAWLRATHPEEFLRDADEATGLAERAAKLEPMNPNVLNTLAAAYGSAGRFGEAVAAGEQALAAAERAGMAGLVRKIRAELECYRKGKPFRVTVER